MRVSRSYWINQVSLLGFIAVVSAVPAGVAGELFVSFCGNSCLSNVEDRLYSLGTVFGFTSLMLLFLGGVLIPGELLGLIRPYKRNAPALEAEQKMARAVLLTSISVTAWILVVAMVTSAFVIAAR